VNTPARLATFAAGLAAVFVTAVGVGHVVGPVGTITGPGHATGPSTSQGH